MSDRAGAPPTKKVLYVDMDNVLVHFSSGIARLGPEIISGHEGNLDETPGLFSLMDPMPGALDAYRELADSTPTSSRQHRGRTRRHGPTNCTG